MANRALGNIEVGYRNHVLDAGQGIAYGVGVDRGERTLVTGVHGLQHIEGFFAADFADHDAVGAHTQTVDDQLTLADGAFALDVGGPGFEADDVFLLELKFGGVFDGDDALYIGNVSGKNVEQRGFSRAGTAGNQKIQLALDHD